MYLYICLYIYIYVNITIDIHIALCENGIEHLFSSFKKKNFWWSWCWADHWIINQTQVWDQILWNLMFRKSSLSQIFSSWRIPRKLLNLHLKKKTCPKNWANWPQDFQHRFHPNKKKSTSQQIHGSIFTPRKSTISKTTLGRWVSEVRSNSIRKKIRRVPFFLCKLTNEVTKIAPQIRSLFLYPLGSAICQASRSKKSPQLKKIGDFNHHLSNQNSLGFLQIRFGQMLFSFGCFQK